MKACCAIVALLPSFEKLDGRSTFRKHFPERLIDSCFVHGESTKMAHFLTGFEIKYRLREHKIAIVVAVFKWYFRGAANIYLIIETGMGIGCYDA